MGVCVSGMPGFMSITVQLLGLAALLTLARCEDNYPPAGYLDSQQDCPNIYADWPGFCNDGHEVYHYSSNKTRKNGVTSCASCTCLDGETVETPFGTKLYREWDMLGGQCCPGWNGTRCNVCLTTSVCPQKLINGTWKDPVNCSNGHLTPTTEEAVSGKYFSCACGGGEDLTSPKACASQADTSFVFTQFGMGTSSDPARLQFAEMADIKRTTDVLKYINTYPTMNSYDYSNVFMGNITGCKITEGNCMNVPFTDVSSEQCMNWDCSNTQLSCPPAGYPTCPGWNGKDSCDCLDPSGIPDSNPKCNRKYQYRLCENVPSNDQGFLMSCLKAVNPDGTHVCYFTQPNSVAPLSMTCSVGNCLYETQDYYVYPSSRTTTVPDVDSQIGVVSAVAGSLLFSCFILYFVIQSFERATTFTLRKLFFRSNTAEGGSKSLDAMPLFEGTCDKPTPAAPMVTWQHVSTWVPADSKLPHIGGEKKILHGLSGRAGACSDLSPNGGGVTALMGPSGAGKTSLLDCLAGRQDSTVVVNGSICIDGYIVSPQQMRDMSSYVTQHDVLPGMMSVREHLLFHARLRMHQTTIEEKHERVSEVLSILNLTAVGGSLIGDEFTRGLSGGEKRRLSIASELLINRKILFLDEPTTGLDSANAFNVVKLLSQIGREGTTIILSIHQPRLDIMSQFQSIYLLAAGGKLAFTGSFSQVMPFFQPFISSEVTVSNPADAMLDLCSSESSAQVIKSFEPEAQLLAQSVGEAIVGPKPIERSERLDSTCQKAPLRVQLIVLSTRLLRKSIRHPMLMCMHYLGAIFMAVILGSIFENLGYDLDGVQNRIGVLFFILFYLSLMSITSLPVWRDENLLFQHESSNGIYDKIAYLVTYLLFDIALLRLLPPLAFTVISYEWMDLQEFGAWRVYSFSYILVAANCTMTLFSMGLGVLRLSTTTGNLAGALMVLVFTLTCGLLINSKQLNDIFPTMILHNLNPLTYAFEALVMDQFHKAQDENGEYVINA